LLFRRGFSTAVPPATRLQARAVWDLLVFALNGVIFILIGLQLRTLGAAVGDAGPLTVLREGLLVSAAVIVARLVWVPVAAVVPRLVPAVRRRDPMPPWSAVLLVAWTGMRGVVSLAAALALPLTTVDGLPLPFRERIILITFVVVVVTLVLQGLTLPPLIRLLRLPPDDTLEREQATALAHRLRAGRERLEELAREPWAAPDQLERLRQAYRRSAAVPVGGDALASSLEEAVFKRARYETLLAERQALIRLRDAGAIGEEVLSEMEAELDREAARHGLAHIRHYPPAPARGTGPGG
ncbi:MAG TPA: cation:proton antiporter, partial [Gemmatimonadales bacterium]|nr:cation:proton antiporter [Gemmatimonadales bacterium]